MLSIMFFFFFFFFIFFFCCALLIYSHFSFRFEAFYSKILPEFMLGQTFLEKYADHNDPVTVIDSKRNYGLRAAANHPIYENFRVKVRFFLNFVNLCQNGMLP